MMVWRVWQRGSARLLRFGTRLSGMAAVSAGRFSTETVRDVLTADYQDAICTLNTLQTDVCVLQETRHEPRDLQLQLQQMVRYLGRVGLTLEEVDRLNIIHVTGTKGKGSTCAFTEKILRGYGFRTGFYSSPHLVQVRERIRISGQPIRKELFTKYFWQVYGLLDRTKDAHGGVMPSYFRFLTILAFHVFLQEKVDLAVIEVGIGGTYDCTNIIRRPWVCGISSLGIDHTHILGDTIDKIAWQKGGIFKPGVPAFTVRQPLDAMTVLRDRARELRCPLWVCPDLEQYPVDVGQLHLGLAGHYQRPNASLALQLSHIWLQKRCRPDLSLSAGAEGSELLPPATCFTPSPVMVKGLAETEWPGRSQTIKHGPVMYFLDGAHTMRSIQACVQWFQESAAQHERNASGPVARVLLFNTSGERDSSAMLKLLVPCQFDFAVFCPNIADVVPSSSADQKNFNVSMEDMLTRCLDNERSWRLHSCKTEDVCQRLVPLGSVHLGSVPLVAEKKVEPLVFPCILGALRWITQGRDSVLHVNQSASPSSPVQSSVQAKGAPLREAAEIHVLVTGSLYLVGGVLRHIEPSYSD